MKASMKASALALAALWAGAVLAQGPAAAAHADHMEKLALLLDLTDAQKPQVATILQGQHAQMRTLVEQTKAAGGTPDFQALQQMHPHGFGHRGPPPGAPAAPPQSH